MVSGRRDALHWPRLLTCRTESAINSSRTSSSTSESFLMYKHATLEVCLPNFANSFGWFGESQMRYRVRLAFRGENAATGQSSSLPSAYLITRLPNPTIAVPHMTASSPVTLRNVSKTFNASARRRSSATPFKNSTTLAPVGLVFISFAIATSPSMSFCLPRITPTRSACRHSRSTFVKTQPGEKLPGACR